MPSRGSSSRLLQRCTGMLVVPVDQALVSGVNFLVVFASARCMPVEEFGIFALVWAAVLFLTNIHFALFLNPLPVLLPEKDDHHAGTYLAALHAIQQPFVAVVVVIAVGVVVLGPWSATLIWAGALLAVTRAYLEHERRVGYAAMRIRNAVALDAVACIPPAVLAALAAFFGWRFEAVHALVVISFFAFAGYLVGRVVNRSVRKVADREHCVAAAREHWGYGKWTLGSTLSLWGSSQAYPFILAAFTGLAEVALFSACKGVLGVVHFALQGLDAYFIPTLRRRLTENGPRSLLEGTRRASAITAVFAGGGCVLIALFPQALLELFYGDKYLTGAWVLRTLALLYLVMIACRLLQVVLHALKAPRAVFAASIINTVLTLSLGPLLIGTMGLAGALVGQGLNYLIDLTVIAVVVRRRFGRLLKRPAPGPVDEMKVVV